MLHPNHLLATSDVNSIKFLFYSSFKPTHHIFKNIAYIVKEMCFAWNRMCKGLTGSAKNTDFSAGKVFSWMSF